MTYPNAGAYYLSALGLSGPALGKELGVSKMTVSYWLSGERKPGSAARDKIAQRWPHIEPKLWDQVYDSKKHRPHLRVVVEGEQPPPVDPTTNTVSVTVPRGIFGKAEMLERTVARLLAECDANSDLSMAERATVAVKVADTLERLAKIRGEWEISRRLFKTPAWKDVCEAMRRALQGHPEVARLLAIELSKVDRRHTLGDAAADQERFAEHYYGIGTEDE